MPISAAHRTEIVHSLLPDQSQQLLDVGCGPITSEYAFSDKAIEVTCVDWKLQIVGSIPSNVRCLEGDFTQLDLPKNYFDTIIAADVFEHIALENERSFIERCVASLKPGGHLVMSVPHQGTFAYLDPYRVKPAIHYLLWRVGLYRNVHNGYCDIRKGHKHYTVDELEERFSPLRLIQTIYFGYFFDPVQTWAVALSRGSGQFPGRSWLERVCRREFQREYGRRSFNVALKFYKPEDALKTS